jgi:hypothetical protein
VTSLSILVQPFMCIKSTAKRFETEKFVSSCFDISLSVVIIAFATGALIIVSALKLLINSRSHETRALLLKLIASNSIRY